MSYVVFIHINGLLNTYLDAEIFCCADDTVILVKSLNYDNIYNIASNYLYIVNNWCDINNL